MKLKVMNPDNLDKNLKATVHKTGKLGFTIEAARKMGLTVNTGVMIAINDEDSNDDSLYLTVHSPAAENMFKASKAGDYHYISTKALFDTLKVDYKNESIVYDISQELINGATYYKLKRREIPKKDKVDMFGNLEK